MTKNLRIFASLRFCSLFLVLSATLFAQNIPQPKDMLGFTPGDDRKLASWKQVLDYFEKLDKASDRVQFQEIGKTTMNNPFVYATISSPNNFKNLEKYKQINAKLADPRLIKSNDNLAKQLIKEGKTIVLVTYGIHSTEVGSYLSSMLMAHKLATSNDPEVLKILENTIILMVPSLNPDGVDIVKNWYDKTLGTPYEGTSPPELYHKYLGHDNNRDWYIFSQVETQLTVDKLHNVWHPQIVNDVHQQGSNGARLFVPPYMEPVEPNVPKEIVEGYTELGNYIANSMRKDGFQGITTNSTYDAWTPARAYSHYHGGVRILTETASARIASPITVEFERLRSDLGYDVKKESDNFKPLWKGGEWKLRDITNYMTASTFNLLKHASDNREKWLTRFYSIGKEAVRPRKSGELHGFILPNPNEEIIKVIERAGVDYYNDSKNNFVVPINQPYGSFAKALFEKQVYPNLKDEKGNPIPPYDVTAHTLSLLMNFVTNPIYTKLPPNKGKVKFPISHSSKEPANNAIYNSYISSMDEGWTRWAFETNYKDYSSLENKDIVKGNLIYEKTPQVNRNKSDKIHLSSIIFPDQPANQIFNGYPKGAMPDEYVGGVGKEGVENLKKFVEAGGTLVFLNRSSNFAIEQFKLPVKNVTQGLNRKDFYIPGSILRIELDTNHPIAKEMEKESIAWFEQSPAFEIQTDPLALTNNFKIIARYPSDSSKILLSGWALGQEKLAGKAALVEFTIGKGKIILFGFRPQYRGQSLATFPLLFNSISN